MTYLFALAAASLQISQEKNVIATSVETNAAGPPNARIALPKNSARQMASTHTATLAERLYGAPADAPALECAKTTNANSQTNPSNSHNDVSSSTPAMVARLRYAWRCISCRRILMRHHMPLNAIASLIGPLHIRCHCNHDNWLK